jgi:phage protein U
MSDVMLALGDFQFGVATAEYQGLKTSNSWRWVSMARFGRRPAKQFHGPEASTKTLSVTIYPESKADLAHFQTIKDVADLGEPVRLVSGGSRSSDGVVVPAGSDLGLWVIESLDIDESMFMRDGVALEQKGTITISEYGEDEV